MSYALCNDRRTLLWFANQRAVEYHPTLVRVDRPERMTHLVLDLDPPEGDDFARGRAAAHLVRQASTTLGLPARSRPAAPRACTSSCRSTTPRRWTTPPPRPAHRGRAERLDPDIATTAFMKEDRGGKVFVDSTRVGGATVVAAYSPRARPGVPVSFPVALGRPRRRRAADFTVHTALDSSATRDPWAERCPSRSVPADLVAEGHEIPIAPRAGHARGQAPQAGRRK